MLMHARYSFSLFVIILALDLTYSDNRIVENDRYITYTVNYGEGFNLRRDVYMRVVSLVLSLRRETDLNWMVVLPPWPRLYHWKSPHDQNWLSWSKFFDISHLSKVVPCIEFSSYLVKEGFFIDEVLQLQRLEEPFKDGQYIEVVQESTCSDSNIRWVPVFGNENVKIGRGICVSAQGRVSVMADFLRNHASTARSFLIRNFENMLHEDFGGIEYWKIRQSMVYSLALRNAGNQFLVNHLNYNPGEGNGRQSPFNGGGMYIGAHLRRKDFLYSHKGTVPSLEGVVNQLNAILKHQRLTAVFIASDDIMDDKFQKALEKIDAKVYYYKPSKAELQLYGDGGISIIDQWILSHAKYFIGTTDSTFSYRVREDRQFMGFSVETIFNDFCGPSHNDNDPNSCPKPSKWLLINDSIEGVYNTKTEL